MSRKPDFTSIALSVVPMVVLVGIAWGTTSSQAEHTRLQARENKANIEKLDDRLRVIETQQSEHGTKLDTLHDGQRKILDALDKLAPRTIRRGEAR